MPVSFPLFGRATKEKAAGPVDWLIVGLGNPGQKYVDTRHNAGWHLLDTIVRDNPHFRFDKNRSKGLIARGELAGVKVALLKPQTFMNLSGEAVGPVAQFYKVAPAQILVAFDDVDLPTAALRLRPKGGAGGHKGMRSIIQHLGTEEFPRLRLGIGRPPGQMPVEAYVLQKFKADEWEAMLATYERGIEAIKAVLTEGIDAAMNQFNVRE
ncbi:MAG TPA: aminoacyl-tRNA hydrolase [Anaerolineae bacterium]|jgi:PTH1 family peptidyl-tRNA hydrolase|nr:aminoacyl-tRNA hydrolase [Anaerolineae bacterium]HXV98399.1 aminoacyl-tRNA hydrolase [Anaerolineae bacterium]